MSRRWHGFFGLALGLAACAPTESDDVGSTDEPVDDSDTGDSTLPPLCRTFVERPVVAPDLVAWADGLGPLDDPFYGRARLEALDGTRDGALSLVDRVERGWHRLRVGRVDDALVDLTIAEARAAAGEPEVRGLARQVLAVAWMRKAEIDNCVASGTGASCLVPFDAEAVHQLREGMTNAATVLEAYLREDAPDATGPRWLLNVARMALGEWPSGVADDLRMTPAGDDVDAGLPAWENVGPDVGLARPTLAGGATIQDFDGDGRLDLLTSSMEPTVGMRLMLGLGDGSFCDASSASGLSAVVGVLQFEVADYDNDGDLDLVAPRGGWMAANGVVRPSLLRNDGAGRFVDVAVEAGLADTVGPSQAAAWADVDGDGWLDLFVGREIIDRGTGETAPSSLYLNRRDGTFDDVAEAMGVREPGFVKGAGFADVDDDGDPDLYVGTSGSSNHLYVLDRERLVFRDVARDLGVTAPWESFAVLPFDHDQDGRLDLWVAAYETAGVSAPPTQPNYGRAAAAYVADVLGLPGPHETMRLYRNTGDGFEDVTAAVSLDNAHATMGVNTGDFDADGWPDLYLGTGAPAFDALEPNVAYRNASGARFDDVTGAMRTGQLQKGHGVAFGDIDGDGDEDLLAETGGAYPGDAFPDALYLNPAVDARVVVLHLEGTTSPRTPFGARVRVVTDARTFHLLYGTDSSFGGNSLPIEAGLGASTSVDRVEIDWPSGDAEVVEDVAIGDVLWIREGEGVVRRSTL